MQFEAEKSKSSFMQAFQNGEVTAEALDDYVGAWHEGASSLSLHAFLGMSREEYAGLITEKETVETILEARLKVAKSKVAA